MAQVYILLGGNEGDRFFYLSKALELIHKHIGHVIQKSSYYETAPWGFECKSDFLNRVIVIQTNHRPQQVLECTQKIEQKLGRIRLAGQQSYTPRNIDIDILFYDQELIDDENLTIPHSYLHERRFTLEPLNEISPGLMHPRLSKSVGQLLTECKDRHAVKKKVKFAYA